MMQIFAKLQCVSAGKLAEKTILFVCTGNTCRSPMAQGLVAKAIGGDPWLVRSAGVAASVGSRESRDTATVLAKRGASLSDFRSRQVNEVMLRDAVAVVCMTSSHRDCLLDEFPEFSDKYYLLGDFSATTPGCDVPDPIGMGLRAYERVGDVIEDSIPGLLRFLKGGE